LRYGVGEQLYGYDQIAAFRAGRDPGFVVERDLLKLWIVTYGRDFGTANCEFRRHGATRTGRQSHTWMRTPEGWRIVAAHVSLLGEPTVMKK
jgi:AtzH-like